MNTLCVSVSERRSRRVVEIRHARMYVDEEHALEDAAEIARDRPQHHVTVYREGTSTVVTTFNN